MTTWQCRWKKDNSPDILIDPVKLRLFHKEGEPCYAYITLFLEDYRAIQDYDRLKILNDDHVVFKGYATWVPAKPNAYEVMMVYVASPQDKEQQQRLLEEKLAKGPYCIPYCSTALSPKAVWEGRAAFLHIDRVSHELSCRPIFDHSRLFIDTQGLHERQSVSMRTVGAPLNKVNVEIAAEWSNTQSGIMDMAPMIESHFPGGRIATYASRDLQHQWRQLSGHFKQSGYEVLDDEVSAESGSFAGNKQVPLQRTRFKARLLLGWSCLFTHQAAFKMTVHNDYQDLIPQNPRERDLQIKVLHPVAMAAEWKGGYQFHAGDCVYYQGAEYQCKEDHLSQMQFDQSKWEYLHPVVLGPSENKETLFQSAQGKRIITHAYEVAKAHIEFSTRSLEVAFKIICDEDFDPIGDLDIGSRVCVRDYRINIQPIYGYVTQYQVVVQAGKTYALITLGCALGKGHKQEGFDAEKISIVKSLHHESASVPTPSKTLRWLKLNNSCHDQHAYLQKNQAKDLKEIEKGFPFLTLDTAISPPPKKIIHKAEYECASEIIISCPNYLEEMKGDIND